MPDNKKKPLVEFAQKSVKAVKDYDKAKAVKETEKNQKKKEGS